MDSQAKVDSYLRIYRLWDAVHIKQLHSYYPFSMLVGSVVCDDDVKPKYEYKFLVDLFFAWRHASYKL